MPRYGEFDQPALDPENLEPDFEVAAEILRGYASGVTEFTLRELRDELHDHNVATPIKTHDFRHLVEDMQDRIVEHYAGHNKTVQWLLDREGRTTYYKLAYVETEGGGRSMRVPLRSVVELRTIPAIGTQPIPKPLKPITEPAEPVRPVIPELKRPTADIAFIAPKTARPLPERTVKPEQPQPVDVAEQARKAEEQVTRIVFGHVRNLILENSKGAMKRSWLLSRLEEEHGIPPVITDAVLDRVAKAADGRLYETKIRGQLYFTLEPTAGTTPSTANAPAATHPHAEKRADRPLNDQEIEVAIAIIDQLAAPGTHINRGVTIKNLHAQFGDKVPKRTFNRLLRALEAERFLSVSSQANYSQARKSPKVNLRGQDTKNRWRANRDSYISRIRNIRI